LKAQLWGDWAEPGELRTEVRLDDLLGLLGAPNHEQLAARMAADVACVGPWVLYARRLDQQLHGQREGKRNDASCAQTRTPLTA
jgi:hypothetical protein